VGSLLTTNSGKWSIPARPALIHSPPWPNYLLPGLTILPHWDQLPEHGTFPETNHFWTTAEMRIIKKYFAIAHEHDTPVIKNQFLCAPSLCLQLTSLDRTTCPGRC
jgi:hypothetical protein